MSEPAPEQASALVTAGRLTEAVNTASATVRDLIQTVAEESEARDAANVEYGRRNRLLIKIGAAGLAFDIILTGAFIYDNNQAQHNRATIAEMRATNRRLTETIDQFHASTVEACRSSNTRLEKDRMLWDYLIGASHAPAGATPQQRAKDAELLGRLRSLVAGKDALRNCPAVYHLGTRPSPSPSALPSLIHRG